MRAVGPRPARGSDLKGRSPEDAIFAPAMGDYPMTTNQNDHADNVVPMLFSTKQAARMIGVSDRTLEDWRLRGIGPRFAKIGRLVRYRPADVMSFIDRPTFRNTGEAHLAA